MKIVFLVVSVALLFSAVVLARELRRNNPLSFRKTVGEIWKNCTKKDDVMKIEYVKITPDEVKQNSDINVFVKYMLRKDITDGTVFISLPDIPIVGNITLNMCDALNFLGMSCPLKQGPGTLNVTQTIPELGLSIQVHGNVKATDQDNEEILCVDLDFKLEE